MPLIREGMEPRDFQFDACIYTKFRSSADSARLSAACDTQGGSGGLSGEVNRQPDRFPVGGRSRHTMTLVGLDDQKVTRGIRRINTRLAYARSREVPSRRDYRLVFSDS